MNILITGSGGREHALAWKIRQNKAVDKIFMAPGNAGTALIATNVSVSTTDEIIEWAKGKNAVSAASVDAAERIDLVIIGPDDHLAEGLVDRLTELGIPTFGPTKAAAQIEWSKAFAKQFMKEEGIPTAAYEIFINIEKAKEHIAQIPRDAFPIVIKASGLALGKGVIIPRNPEEAVCALDDLMGSKVFGEAGSEVVIEEFMQGREISVHAFCDGETAIVLPAAQDHKRIFENDMGPNTGGMGTIAPVPWVTDEMLREIQEKIVMPTLVAMKRRGMPFKGILFPGIMFTDSGPKVIEFNARFGDPETQTFMRLMESDLVDIAFASINGTLNEKKIRFYTQSACCIVCASGGYPGSYEKGKVIAGPGLLDMVAENNDEVFVFHAAMKKNDAGVFVTNGGRVLNVTATGTDLREALAKSYAAIDEISFEGMQYRKDIGKKSLS